MTVVLLNFEVELSPVMVMFFIRPVMGSLTNSVLATGAEVAGTMTVRPFAAVTPVILVGMGETDCCRSTPVEFVATSSLGSYVAAPSVPWTNASSSTTSSSSVSFEDASSSSEGVLGITLPLLSGEAVSVVLTSAVFSAVEPSCILAPILC